MYESKGGIRRVQNGARGYVRPGSVPSFPGHQKKMPVIHAESPSTPSRSTSGSQPCGPGQACPARLSPVVCEKKTSEIPWRSGEAGKHAPGLWRWILAISHFPDGWKKKGPGPGYTLTPSQDSVACASPSRLSAHVPVNVAASGDRTNSNAPDTVSFPS